MNDRNNNMKNKNDLNSELLRVLSVPLQREHRGLVKQTLPNSKHLLPIRIISLY